MANPSLQIGNDNWAIKEDNLLGYSTAGTRFVPQPITMTRATLGTRVNPSGLVEDVELLGSEEVTNGDFATDSDWFLGTGWTISGGNLNASSPNGTVATSQSVDGLTAGKTYKVSFEVSEITSGYFRLYAYVGASGTFTNIFSSPELESGTYETTFEFGGTDKTFRIYGAPSGASALTVGSISNVSVKEYAANDLARVDYTDGTSSLLVEPQRTNLITYSEDFSQWSNTGVQVNINSTISPSGTENASTITGSTTNSRHNVVVSTISGSVSASFSVFAKAKELKYLQIASANSINQYANFDLLSGTIGTIGGGFSNVKIESLDNGWYKISLVSNSQYNSIYLSLASSLTASWLETYSMANNSDSLYLWGGQVEEASYPTSYIPTSGSTVTRNQETYTKTGISDKINSEEGVLFAEISRTEDESNYRLLGLDNGTSQNYIKIGFGNNNGNFWIRALVNGVTVINSDNAVSNNANQFYKIAVRYKSGDSVIYIDGVPVLTSSTTFSSGTFTDLDFTHFTGSSHFFGKVKQLQIFKTALSDSELIALTT